MSIKAMSSHQPAAGEMHAGAPARVKVVWLDGSDVLLDSLLADWLQMLHGDPLASVYLHPELALAHADQPAALPAIYARKHQDDEYPNKLAALAVLPPKIIRAYPIPGCRWGIPLQGYWLAGNQLLGQHASQTVAEFVAAAVHLLNSSNAQCIYFDDINVDSDLWNAIHDAGRAGHVIVSRLYTPQTHWWIQFPDDPEQYWQHVHSKTRRNLRSAARKLEHSVTCFTQKHQVPLMLDQVHQVSLQTWQAKRLGRTIRASSSTRQFWETIASIGALRSYILSHDGRPMAFLLASHFNGRMILEEQGYDMSLRALSPGSVLYLRVLDDLIARNTPRLVDFGFGHADYKEWLCNRQTLTGPVMMIRRSCWPATVMWLDGLRRKLSERLHTRLRDWRLAGLFRRIYRR